MRLRLVGTVAAIALCCMAGLAHGQSCDTHNPCMTNGMCMSDGTCQGTRVTGGSCTVPLADALCMTATGTCMNGVCQGTPAAAGTNCAAGCGTCQELVPGIPASTLCMTTSGQEGKTCDAGYGPCFPGVCGSGQFALCQITYKTCPDIDHNPCTTDVCNPATGQCEHSDSPPCVPTCETCNPSTGCEPANEGVACEFTGECKVESHCERTDTGGVVRGLCVRGATTAPSPTPEVGSPSPTPTPTPLPPGPTATPSVLPPTETPTATTPTPGGCTGDCDGNHLVAANEVIQLLQFAQGIATDLSACPHGIPTGITAASQVTIAHLIQAVNNAQSACNG